MHNQIAGWEGPGDSGCKGPPGGGGVGYDGEWVGLAVWEEVVAQGEREGAGREGERDRGRSN